MKDTSLSYHIQPGLSDGSNQLGEEWKGALHTVKKIFDGLHKRVTAGTTDSEEGGVSEGVALDATATATPTSPDCLDTLTARQITSVIFLSSLGFEFGLGLGLGFAQPRQDPENHQSAFCFERNRMDPQGCIRMRKSIVTSSSATGRRAPKRNAAADTGST